MQAVLVRISRIWPVSRTRGCSNWLCSNHHAQSEHVSTAPAFRQLENFMPSPKIPEGILKPVSVEKSPPTSASVTPGPASGHVKESETMAMPLFGVLRSVRDTPTPTSMTSDTALETEGPRPAAEESEGLVTAPQGSGSPSRQLDVPPTAPPPPTQGSAPPQAEVPPTASPSFFLFLGENGFFLLHVFDIYLTQTN